MNYYGNKIRDERKKQNLTQLQLSDKARIAINSLRRYESGERKPTIDVIERIASALNIPFSSLISEDMLKDNTEPDRVALRHAFGVHHGDRENIACKQLLRLNEEDQNAICHLIGRLYALEMENDSNDYDIGDDDASKIEGDPDAPDKDNP